MLWLGTSPNNANVAKMLDTHQIGLMCQWKSNLPKAGWIWAADNGCFADKWDETTWLRWLKKDWPRAGCLFATAPDVVGNHDATLERFDHYEPIIRELRYPVAFVAQDGASESDIPWDRLDTLFLGGSTEWKMSIEASQLCLDAAEGGKWVHIGRVNSFKRLQHFSSIAHSSDGTHLKFEPDVASVRVARWVENLRQGTQLTMIGEGNG